MQICHHVYSLSKYSADLFSTLQTSVNKYYGITGLHYTLHVIKKLAKINVFFIHWYTIPVLSWMCIATSKSVQYLMLEMVQLVKFINRSTRMRKMHKNIQ